MLKLKMFALKWNSDVIDDSEVSNLFSWILFFFSFLCNVSYDNTTI